MKKIYSIILVITLGSSVFISSCKKGDVDKKFDLSLTGIVLNVDSMNFDGNEKVFAQKLITTGIEAELNKNGATLQNIKKIELSSVDLTITTPTGQTFDGVDYLVSYINAGTLGEAKVAYKSPIPQTSLTTISQDNQFADLTEYIKQTEFTFIVKGYNSIDLPAMTLTANIKFSVTATVAK